VPTGNRGKPRIDNVGSSAENAGREGCSIASQAFK
jgi:hypothetical protein